MSKRWCYPGREFTRADNPRLPYPLRVLPDGTVYAHFDTGMRRLDVIKTSHGLAISTLAECQVFIMRNGLVLVGDEITKRKQDKPAPAMTIDRAVDEVIDSHLRAEGDPFEERIRARSAALE